MYVTTLIYNFIFRALEGMFRSLNSLLEKFHQSFFFYLLPSTSRYISIGLYMPPLGCVMIGPIFAAISCWISSVQDKGMLQSGQMSRNVFRDYLTFPQDNQSPLQETSHFLKDALVTFVATPSLVDLRLRTNN